MILCVLESGQSGACYGTMSLSAIVRHLVLMTQNKCKEKKKNNNDEQTP